MAHDHATTPSIPCAGWQGDGQAPGSRVVCTCGETLAQLYLHTDQWGAIWRTLVFPHGGWVNVNGIWRDTTHASWSRERGWPAKARRTHYPSPTVGPLGYAAAVRCPRCGNKRRLDADVLAVVAEIDMWWQASRRLLREQGWDDTSIEALFPAERPAVTQDHILHL